ncbi:hypothetical protein KXW12_001247 [Aspergillus fumigatus]|nr:hypothetical protein KXW69_001321 [Aspergillus fumigatus]KAH1929634.1 hypothetical protein KXV48_002058 [Aspergillus fumigatus]KAH2057743.1 hypothetical protein KXV43_000768 [Aspergillus fumigatus]KAH2536084.1 hypothetical protein KXW12_001247 [Aspergillus fumigatus]KAH2885921.1 hypothetical protein KXV75_005893 [Aspergillus fumigatus]
MIVTPRFHLLELGDQSWCPEWLREYSHLARIQMWKTRIPGTKGSPALQACDILLRYLPDIASYTMVDSCAGGGGPIPIFESTLNAWLAARHEQPVRFILTDLYPSLSKWAALARQSANISYIAQPVDATQARRLAEPGKKECRLFNLCFHHFDDPAAAKVLRSAIQSSDAFVIFEMTHRTASAFLNTTFIVLSPLLTTLLWFRGSPLHMFFTYIFPLVQLFFAVDGYVSCIRGRTPEEVTALIRQQKDLDISDWDFSSGEDMVLPPFGKMYWMNCFTLHLGNTEAILIDAIQLRGGPRIERGVVPVAMELEEGVADDPDAYPLKIQLRHQKLEHLTAWRTNAHSVQADGTVHEERGGIDAAIHSGRDGERDTEPVLTGEEGSLKTIRAKYVIGSDGAHSWVRRWLGFEMEGDSTNAVWGVVDAILDSDFPDFRRHCTILSQHGTILSVPRENGMTRLYVQLPDSMKDICLTDAAQVVKIMAVARRSLFPYTLEYSYCDWWTIYRVGRRVANHFTYKQRVFLGGDAVHTHTPKGGQGMNVSMQDAYNLGWKLGGVLRGQLRPSVLATYESERRPVAQDLIKLDTSMGRVLAGETMSETPEVLQVYEQLRNYGSGANICYSPNILVASPQQSQQHLAAHLRLGMRFPSHPVVNLASAITMESQSLLPSNGSWRLWAFAGNVVACPAQLKRVNSLGEKLCALTARLAALQMLSTPFLEILLLYKGRVEEMEVSDFHPIFTRRTPQAKSWDHRRIFADPPLYAANGGLLPTTAHAKYGIDDARGCMVVIRPDQCVAWIGELEDERGLEEYFDRFVRW